MTKELDPFNFDRFIAGEDALTREGRRVKFWMHKPDARPGNRLVGGIDGLVFAWHENGKFLISENERCTDLTHMAPRTVKREVWVRHRKNSRGRPSYCDVVHGKPRHWSLDEYYTGPEFGPIYTYEVEE